MAAYNYITFDKFVDKFKNRVRDPLSQEIVFISVGAEANLLAKGISKLKNENNHQYIPYLQYIKGLYPEIPLHIVLIDPDLYNPPYCVQSSVVHFPFGKYTDPKSVLLPNNFCMDENYNNVYIDTNNLVTVYAIKDKVEYEYKFRNKSNNMNPQYYVVDKLYELNEYCKSLKDILFFHDFTGRNTFEIANMFDTSLDNYKNRIVYDMTLRLEGCCTIKMDNPYYFLKVMKDSDNNIYVCNPYNIPHNMLIAEYSSTIDEIYKTQILICVTRYIKIFFDIIFPIYRQLFLLNSSKSYSTVTIDDIINKIKTVCDHSLIYYSLEKMSLYELFLMFGKIMSKYFKNILSICFKGVMLDNVYKSLMVNLHKNMYMWQDSVMIVMLEQMKVLNVDIEKMILV